MSLGTRGLLKWNDMPLERENERAKDEDGNGEVKRQRKVAMGGGGLGRDAKANFKFSKASHKKCTCSHTVEHKFYLTQAQYIIRNEAITHNNRNTVVRWQKQKHTSRRAGEEKKSEANK